MSIRYYKLFNIIDIRKIDKNQFKKVISPITMEELKKGDIVNKEIIEKICDFIHCQPGDIMEYITEKELEDGDIERVVPQLNGNDYIQWMPKNMEPENDYRLSTEYNYEMKKEH